MSKQVEKIDQIPILLWICLSIALISNAVEIFLLIMYWKQGNVQKLNGQEQFEDKEQQQQNVYFSSIAMNPIYQYNNSNPNFNQGVHDIQISKFQIEGNVIKKQQQQDEEKELSKQVNEKNENCFQKIDIEQIKNDFKVETVQITTESEGNVSEREDDIENKISNRLPSLTYIHPSKSVRQLQQFQKNASEIIYQGTEAQKSLGQEYQNQQSDFNFPISRNQNLINKQLNNLKQQFLKLPKTDTKDTQISQPEITHNTPINQLKTHQNSKNDLNKEHNNKLCSIYQNQILLQEQVNEQQSNIKKISRSFSNSVAISENTPKKSNSNIQKSKSLHVLTYQHCQNIASNNDAQSSSLSNSNNQEYLNELKLKEQNENINIYNDKPLKTASKIGPISNLLLQENTINSVERYQNQTSQDKKQVENLKQNKNEKFFQFDIMNYSNHTKPRLTINTRTIETIRDSSPSIVDEGLKNEENQINDMEQSKKRSQMLQKIQSQRRKTKRQIFLEAHELGIDVKNSYISE